ncbi:unnamed protein product [Merluccius merluccius]
MAERRDGAPPRPAPSKGKHNTIGRGGPPSATTMAPLSGLRNLIYRRARSSYASPESHSLTWSTVCVGGEV